MFRVSLIVTGANGAVATATATVTVTGVLAATLTATPTMIAGGGSSTLAVASTNAVSAVIEPGNLSVPLDASGAGSVSVSPTETTTYTLTVTDSNAAAATATAVVIVTDPAAGNISTVAGSGRVGFGGDSHAADAALLWGPFGVAADGAGNLYIADWGNHRIRKIDAASGNISTVAGSGAAGPGNGGFDGDGGPADAALLDGPFGVAVDGSGNLFIADTDNHRIRKVDAATGDISTVAGSGAAGFSGDGGPATAARLNGPFGVAVDGAGNLYIADADNHRIRKVDAATKYISTFAGSGAAGFSGDGSAADAARLNSPLGVAVDGSGNLYIADWNNQRIRKVDAVTKNISTVAGSGAAGFGNGGFDGDDAAADAARLDSPSGVAVDGSGNLYIADRSNQRIRRVDAVTKNISTFAGSGTEGFSGDGGPADAAQLHNPSGVAVDGSGNLYIADFNNLRIRRVGPPPIALTATPATIAAGRSAVLTWFSANGVTAEIDNNVGTVTPAAGGSVGVSPTQTTEYTLTVTDANGATATDTATVTVTANNAPTGAVTISGTATQGETLTADTSGIADADGLGTFSYQWKRDGAAIPGATGATYVLTQADVGAAITVTVSWTDDGGAAESLTSTATAEVADINDAPTGAVTIDGTATQGETLTAVTTTIADPDGPDTLTFSYQWKRDGTAIPGATGATYVLTQADVGAAITVTVSWTDDGGAAESLTSAATAEVANVNDAPTGAVTISGTATQGETLTADTSGIADADGLGTFSYQWKRDGAAIPGATGATYVLTQADVGAAITVTVSWTDDGGAAESLTSDATAEVADINDAPTGSVTIDGTATQGETLTAVTDTIADPDGPDALTFSYQWKRDGTAIPSATGVTYVLEQADVGAAITVTVSWTDDGGTAESLTSAATAEVADINDAPTGAVTIDGTATQGETLTAVTDTITDPDGPDTLTFSYQWKRDGTDITGAVGSTYVLEQADVGAAITVTVSWTDDGGTAESLTSAATAAVANVNDAPTGAVTISGTATQGQTLTAVTSGIVDPDGPATLTFSYQWQRDGTDITGAVGSTYVLEQADVGAAITVTVSWTDDGGTAESLTSDATTEVADINDAPTGAVTISGTATQGETLTAVTDTITDPDGPDTLTFSYQWKRDGTDITGAVGSTYVLEQADVGAAITVTVSWTDDGGTAESLTSDATTEVADINDAPTGAVTINGTATQGETLTAVTDTIADPDGPATLTFSYEWKRDGTAIPSATGATYVLEQADVGAAITVTVSWTDDGGAAESLTSAATAAVANVNDAPTGSVTISGTATQGETLTAVTDTITDPDGPDTLTFSYQWKRDGTAIPGATGATYVLEQADVGAAITVTVSWTDDGGTAESLTSDATTEVADINDAPTGAVTIDGTATQGETLTAVTDTVVDPDGPATLTFSYQWKRDGTAIPSATGATYVLEQADVGAAITVTVSWTDDGGTDESLTSDATAEVADINDAPTGAVTIDGTATQGETLTAVTDTIVDPDGPATLTFSYQWKRDGTAIPSATGATYVLEQADVGAAITVTVSWTDDGGTEESLTSDATAEVADINDAPTAEAGDPQTVDEGETVTLNGSGSTDPEGEALTYAWTQTSGETVTLSDTTAASPTFTAPEQLTEDAVLVFSLTVTDARNKASAADTVTITVTAGSNDAPTAEAGDPQTVDEGETVTLDGSGSTDPEGEALTYAWTQTSGETVTLSDTTAASPTFTAPEQLTEDAVLVFSLTVTDARNKASAADTVTITVTAGSNDAPTAEAGDPQTVAEGETVTLDGSGSTDPEGEALTYAWTQTSGETVTLSGANTASPTFTAPEQLTEDAVLVFSLTVTDARNKASAADTVTITVTAGSNDAPTAEAGDPQTVAEGETVTLDGSGSTDPEGEALTYAWTQTSGETVTLSGANTASPTFTAPEQLTEDAVLVFSLTVTDARNKASAADTVTITVTAGSNDAPTAEAGDPQTVDEGETVTLNGSGTDPEGEALTYAWTQTSGETVTLSGANTASPTFTAPEQLTEDAVLVFSLTVTDARNKASAADTVTITVTAGSNDAPTAEAGDPQTVDEGETVTLNGSGTDPEGEALTYAWTQTSGETVTLSGANTASPTFTAPEQLTEDAVLVFSLTVTDARNKASAADTVTITVTAGSNDAPTAEAGDPQTVDEGETVTLDGSGSTDPEGEALTYAWTQTSGETVTLSDTTAASPTFTAPEQLTEDAVLVFSLIVTDARSAASAADTVTITVTAGSNDAPTAEAGDPQTVDEGETVTLNGSGSTDPEGEALTYAWTQTSGETVTLSDTTAASPTFTAPEQLTEDAVLVFSLIVTDARSAASAADTVTITVTAGSNDAPTAEAGDPQTVDEGETVTLNGSGSTDPEGEALTYAWTQTSGETVTLSDTTAASPTFTAPEQLTEDAVLVFSLTVTDARNKASAADTVTITVTAGSNDAPTAEAGDPQTVDEGETVTLDGSGSTDPEGEALTYAWTQTSGETVTLSDTTAASPTFTAPEQLTEDAVLVFSLTVTDARNKASAADTVTITVTAGSNDAPTAEAGDPQTVDEGETVTLDGSGSTDPEGEALTYAWTQTSGETVTLSDTTAASPTFTAPEQLTEDEQLVFSLIVTDARSAASAADTVTITVTAGSNDAPTAEAGDPQTVDEGETVTLNGSGTDPEGEALTYAWTQTSGETVTLSDTTAASPTFTAPEQLTEDAVLVFSLTVTDARNKASAADTVTITVTAGSNDAPTAEAGDPQTVAEGATVTLNGSGSTDPEGEALTYAWTQTSGETVTLSDTTAASPTFTAPEQLTEDAVLVFSLTVTDARGLASTADTVTITVTAGANEAPTAEAGDPQTVDEGETVTLDGSGSTDPEGEALTYAWTQTSGETVTLSDTTAASPTFTAPEQLTEDAVLVFSLTVTDARNAASAADTVTITVTAGSNDAPTAEAGDPQTVAEGATVTLNGSGTDPEGEALTYAWTQTSGETVTLSDTTAASPTFTAPEQLTEDAVLVFSLTVTDARNKASAADTVTITVTAGSNDAPTAEAGDPQTVDEGETVTLDGSGSTDPEGEALTYAWTQTSGETVTLSDTTAASPTFTAPEQLTEDAVLVFSLTVTDARGAASTPDTVTVTVTAGTNDPPTGAVTISGTASQGETLTAVTNTIADPDGPATLTFSYQWKRDGADISGATSATYTLTQADVGAAITVTVSWTDSGNTVESLTSAPTAAVANVNDEPTGTVTISGTASQGETLTADTSGIADADGLGTFSYQWQRDGTAIPGATAATYVLEQADVGAAITVTVSWTDGGNTAESLTSAATATVTDTNDAPTGTVTISGTATQGEMLTAVTTSIADADGLGTFSYQWKRGGTAIPGATGATYMLTQDDVGATITVTVSWTDGGNTEESLTSTATAEVTNTNDAPTGAVTISGTPTQGETLTAVTTSIADADGLGTFSYQWKRSGTAIPGATGSTYMLTQDDVGATITVTVSWTDGGNTEESLTSTATAVVTNTNDEPTGAVTISGTATQGQTLMADTSGIVDPDGPATLTFSYQWKRDGAAIPGATGATYVLTQADVGAAITVTVSWTDDGGAAESLTSDATAEVADINDAPTGAVTIDGTATQGQTLTADTSGIADADGLGTFSYQWHRDGTDITGATGATYVLEQDDVGAAITVTVSWTDGGNTVESLTSAPTATVTDINDAPTGSVTIDGTATQGETLTADTSGIADADGLGAFSYQWKRDGSDIPGATDAGYVLTQADVGAAITVTVSWTDGGNTVESLTSAPTATVTDINDAPTGTVTISGTATQGQTLTADTSGIADADGLGTFSYQWQRDGADIPGATGASYVLAQADVGAAITVTVSWTDGGNTVESLTSAPTATVTDTNDAPTGAVTISGTATQGQTLTADTSGIADADGLGTFSYQWQRDGADIPGATGASYVLAQADVGAAITVTVSWTDGGNTEESLTSAATAAVTDTNDAPTGAVTISGTASQGETLTADTSGIADADGLGAFSYQWQRDGTAIPGATAATYVLEQDDVGATITVTVSWTDGGNTVESLTSAPTATVTDTNDEPTGTVTISGTASQGETLTADTSGIADADGLGTFSYQWQRDGADIPGATGASYVLAQADVGAAITVTVSWTDGGNTVESLTSAPTATVTDTNDAPTGAVTISGTATQGQTLTADTSGIADADGLGTFSYQWQRDGADIPGATGASYVLAQADVGAAITVTVSWTDGGNTEESLTSAATAAVTDTNDAPTGAVTISGTASQGETLTADTSGIADADGLGTFSYQWQRDGTAIPGATGATYVLEQADVGAAITVTVSWTDSGNTVESLTSAPTATVTDTNDAPTGAVTISGTPTQGQTLTADTSGIADADGLGTFSYQWQRDGAAIPGATGASYVLAQADVGAAITVTVSWTDGGNTVESLTSAPTSEVTNTNDEPTGAVTISGTPTQGETLTAVTTTIADPDGPATLTFSYQWKRDGSDISGATGATYVLTQADVGAAITVTVSWTDDGGTAESLTSAATAEVTDTTDAPTATLTADPATITAGQSSTLRVTSSNAQSAVIQPGALSVNLDNSGAGSVEVTPTATTTYTLTVTDNNSATATDTATVTVTDAPTATLTADPTTITSGQSATLSVASSNAVSAIIQPGNITVTLDQSGAGAVAVSPTQTTTYILTVTDANNATATATVTVTVTDAPTATLSATPATIVRGASATLEWSSTNAVSAEIDQGIGAVALSGTQSVSPTATTTYTLTVSAANGAKAEAQAAVTVSDPPPPGARTIDTVAGSGTPGFSGDGGEAAKAQFNTPAGVALDAQGNLYIADTYNHRVRKVDAATGNIDTAAGDGLNAPADVAIDGAGNLYIADTGNNRILIVDAAGAIVDAVTGTQASGPLSSMPSGAAPAAAGNQYIADTGNNRILMQASGPLSMPSGVALDAEGNLYIADTGNDRILIVDTAGAIVDTVTGTEASGPLSMPSGVAPAADGNLYIADTGNHRVLSVDAEGAIDTVAGTGIQGFDGDGGPAVEAQLNAPSGVAVDAEGAYLYIADTGNQRIRAVDAAGNIDTVAGTETSGSDGDGGLAGAAQLNAPAGVAVDAEGNVYIADTGNHRIRKVDAPPDETVPPEPPVGPRPEPELPAVRARTFEFSFVLAQDAEPAAQQVVLYAENGAANFRAQPGPQWIGAEPASGRLEEDEETTITVTADPAGLRVGAYRGRLYIRSEGRLTGRVWVALEVLPPVGPAVAERGVFNAAVQSALGARTNPFSAVRLLPVAPGSMVVVSGENFTGGESFEAGGFPLPVSLGGVKVKFDGLEARLFAVSPQRIEAQLPSLLNLEALAGGGAATAAVVVETAEGGSYARRFVTAAQAPGIFTASGEGRGQGAVLFSDTGALAAPRGYAAESRPARAGEVLEIYATGLGPVYPPVADGENSCGPEGVCLADGANLVLRRTVERPRVSIGGVEVADEAVLFAGLAPALAAVNLVVVEVPQGIEPSAAAEVTIAGDGRASQPGVTIAVE